MLFILIVYICILTAQKVRDFCITKEGYRLIPCMPFLSIPHNAQATMGRDNKHDSAGIEEI